MKTLRNPDKDHLSSLAQGFTLVELMVVLACLAVLMATLLPAFASGAVKSAALTCLNNQRQLIVAWQKYAEDHNGVLVHNYHGGDAQGGAASGNPKAQPWALGWLDWTTSRDNTNQLFLTEERYSKLAQYLDRSPRVFKCPSDVYVSSAQRARGWRQRSRSVSLSLGIGEGNAEMGPWDPIYAHIRKMTEFIYPSPAESYVFMDEHPDSINDPGIFNPQASNWLDQPATYHHGAAAVAFADGHSEIHRWTGSLTNAEATRIKYNNIILVRSFPNDPDIHWMSYHSPRKTERSY